jgi:ketosteroid isomerase-like protein
VTRQATALELARAMAQAWNAEDPEAVYRLWDPDIVVRPDPEFPEGVMHGERAGREFWQSTIDALGLAGVEILDELDLGRSALVRVRQGVRSASGIEGTWEWSMIVTAREGKAIMIEFFIDAAAARRIAGVAD